MLDRYAINILLLSEGALIALGLVFIGLGGVVAALTLRTKARARRLIYFLCLVGLNLLASVMGFGWRLVPAAADVGALWLLLALMFASFGVNGYLLYYASQARANDIGRRWAKAWMGFVPFVNLLLVFARGREAADAPEIVSRWAHWKLKPADPVLILAGLLVGFGTRAIDRQQEMEPLYSVSDSAVLSRLITEAQTLEESFAREAELSKADVPYWVDDITRVTAVDAEGATLRYRFDLDQRIPGFRVDFESLLARDYCDDEMFGVDIARGGTIALDYYGPNGALMEEFEITSEDCDR